MPPHDHYLFFVGGDHDGEIVVYTLPVPTHSGYTYRGAWTLRDNVRVDVMAYKGMSFKEPEQRTRAVAAVTKLRS